MNKPKILLKHNEISGSWVALCVDFDLVVKAKSLMDIPKALGHVFFGNIVANLEVGNIPKFSKTPDYIVKEWENAKDYSKQTQLLPWDEFVPEWLPESFKKLFEQSVIKHD